MKQSIGRTLLIASLLICLLGLPAPAARPSAGDGAPAAQQTGLDGLSPAARASIAAFLGRDNPGFHFHAAAAGWEASLPGQEFEARISAGGLEVRAGAERFGLALVGYGAGAAFEPAGAASLSASANRVELDRGRLTEWYASGPLGLEQGFTFSAPPAAAHSGLTLALSLWGGLAASIDAGGRGLLLSHAGQPILRYAGLAAYDAAGQDLPARLELDGAARLLVHVDDRGALYPLTIDPWVRRARLTNAGGVPGDNLGRAVALDGDTLVVTGYGSGFSGRAYVFQRKPGSPASPFVQVACLYASDGALSDFFGVSAAISGDTILVGAFNLSGRVYVYVKPPAGWSDAAESAQFVTTSGVASLGFAVAIDGDTALVGAQNNRAAFIYVRPPGGWSGVLAETAALTPSDWVVDDYFGWAVALRGGTAVVSAPLKSSGKGAAYVFTRPQAGWSGTIQETARLHASNAADNDRFGSGVALDGNTVALGAPGHDHNTGMGYVYAAGPGGWNASQTESAQLSPSDSALGAEFGGALSLSGDTLAIGAGGGIAGGSGRAYVFVRPPGGWTNAQENARLIPNAGTGAGTFGFSITTDGATVITGSPNLNNNLGAVYTYARPLTGWSGLQAETAQVRPAAGGPGDSFGYSVAISGANVLVGAYDTLGGTGEAYIFTRPSAGWSGSLTQAARLIPPGSAVGYFFGFSVALDGDTAVVGAPAAQVAGNPNQGKAFVFVQSGGSWSGNYLPKQTLEDPNPQAYDSFGLKVAVQGALAAVGAPTAAPGGKSLQGAAYLFLRPAGGWGTSSNTLAAALAASDNAAQDQFGSALAINNNLVVVGAPGVASGKGAAYVFLQPGGGWSGTVNESARLSDSSGGAHFSFGSAVAANAGTVFAGEQNPAAPGRVSVFLQPGAGWSGSLDANLHLSASDGTAGDQFGRALAVEGDTLVVGAPGAASAAGAVYVFARPPTGWAAGTETARLSAPQGAAGDSLGVSVALSGGVIAAGAPYAAVSGHPQQGAASVFDAPLLLYLPHVARP